MTIPRDAIVSRLHDLDVCPAAIAWVETLPLDTTPQSAWDQCPRADWMMWLIRVPLRGVVIEHRSPLHLSLARCACDIADAVADYTHAHAQTRADLAVVRAWCAGTASDTELRAARDGLSDAAYDSASAYAAYYSASSASSAYSAAAYAYYAACAADADVAYAASAAPALREQIADIIRASFPQSPELTP